VQYLKKLEEEYKDNPEELAKVMAIKVHKDCIEIAGYKLKRQNETAPDGDGIWNHLGNVYFTWDAAIRLY